MTQVADSQAETAFPSGEAEGTRARTDWLLVATLLNVVLLSGAAQYFDIYALAAVNMLLQALLLIRVRFRVSRRLAGPAIFLYVYLLYSFLVLQSASDIVFVAFRFHDFLTSLLLVNYLLVRRMTLCRSLEILFAILIVHGFVNWVLVSNFFHLFSTVPSIKSYKFLIFFGMEEKYMGIHRSQGLFWEPGVYQIYLNIALYYFLFYARRNLWAGLAFAGLVLTLSTTGIILATVQLIVFTLGMKQKLTWKIAKILVALPFFIVYIGFAQTIVEDKISGDRSASYMARSFDTINGIFITLEYPLGIGFNPATYQEIARENVFDIETPLITDRGQTNGILILAYSTGILWAAVILFYTWRQNVFTRYRWLFFFVLGFSLTTEPLFFSPFVWLFTISGMTPMNPLVPSR